MWHPSEHESQHLRAALDCPVDACVYRNGELMAVVFCDEVWHLYVASPVRMPEMGEVLDARQQLLPNIIDYTVTPEPNITNGVHVCELRRSLHRRLQ